MLKKSVLRKLHTTTRKLILRFDFDSHHPLRVFEHHLRRQDFSLFYSNLTQRLANIGYQDMLVEFDYRTPRFPLSFINER